MGDITGFWSESMDFKDLKVRFVIPSLLVAPSLLRPNLEVEPNLQLLIKYYFSSCVSQSPSARTLFDAHESTTTPKQVAPESEQEPNESRRLWHDLTEAIKSKDMEGATEA